MRQGSYTYINKRTGNDIWKNLFELPLIETEAELAEEAFLALPQVRQLLAGAGQPVIKSVCRGVKHVLSHRVIHANFYEVELPAEAGAFGSYQRVELAELGHYAVPRLVHAFLEKYL